MDLVVGADGLHSGVRGLAFGPEPQFVRDLGAYVGIFTTSHLDLDGWELLYSRPGSTAGLYPVRQTAQAKVMFYFASPPRDPPARRPRPAEAAPGGGVRGGGLGGPQAARGHVGGA